MQDGLGSKCNEEMPSRGAQCQQLGESRFVQGTKALGMLQGQEITD